jgi:hypothetical protein
MDKREFLECVMPVIQAEFPTVQSYLAKLPSRDGANVERGQATKQDVLGAWYRRFRDMEVEAALNYTRAVSDGDSPPRYVDQIMRRIADQHRRQRNSDISQRKNRRIAGEDTVACVDCMDHGTVTVWSQAAMSAARDSDDNAAIRAARPRCVAVRCVCEAARGHQWMPVAYDSRVMLAINGPYTDERADALREHVRALTAVENRPNYEPAFDRVV